MANFMVYAWANAMAEHVLELPCVIFDKTVSEEEVHASG
jgi:hypothetical protein